MGRPKNVGEEWSYPSPNADGAVEMDSFSDYSYSGDSGYAAPADK
jgi:hypothetical protein